MTGINRFGANLNVNVARLGNAQAANAYKTVQKEAESLKMNLNKVDCFVKTSIAQQTKEEEILPEATDAKKGKKGGGKGKGKFREKWNKFWRKFGDDVVKFFIELGIKKEATITFTF